MGWAARCRTGLGYRTRLAARRRWAARVAIPRLIGQQLLVLGMALVLFPFRLVAFLAGRAWRLIGGVHG
jgi:hypothetical protein